MCTVFSAAQLQQQTLEVCSESDVDGMTAFLDSLKWDSNGLVAAIVQVPYYGMVQFTGAHLLACHGVLVHLDQVSNTVTLLCAARGHR
jgi:hypothetical protein